MATEDDDEDDHYDDVDGEGDDDDTVSMILHVINIPWHLARGHEFNDSR